MTAHEKLLDCFRNALDLGPDVDVAHISYQSMPAWDSVGHMRLVAAIETSFDIMFSTDQILDMSNLAKAIEILGQHGIAVES